MEEVTLRGREGVSQWRDRGGGLTWAEGTVCWEVSQVCDLCN